VVLPRELARMQTLRLMLDADTGRLLWMENLVKSDRQGQVFPSNPSASTLATVMLDLPAGAQTLENGEIQAINCVDQESCPLSREGTNFRFCESLPLAHADENGDFIYDRPASDTATEDAFSEVQMFYHATRGLDFFHGLGFLGLTEQPMMAMVNLRMPAFDTAACNGVRGTQTLQPLENALFMPAEPSPASSRRATRWSSARARRSILPTTATSSTHELTHRWPPSSARWHAGDGRARPRRFDGRHARGLRRLLLVGARRRSAGGGVRRRRLLRRRRPPARPGERASCATDLTGEEHEDSEMFSGALWAIRSGLAEAERTRFDAAMFVVLDSLARSRASRPCAPRSSPRPARSSGRALRTSRPAPSPTREFDVCAERNSSRSRSAPQAGPVHHRVRRRRRQERAAGGAAVRVSLTNEAHEIPSRRRPIDRRQRLGRRDGAPRISGQARRAHRLGRGPDRARRRAGVHAGGRHRRDLRPAEGVATGNFSPPERLRADSPMPARPGTWPTSASTTDTQQTAAEDGCGCGVGPDRVGRRRCSGCSRWSRCGSVRRAGGASLSVIVEAPGGPAAAGRLGRSS
jgi:hypothetical protein